MTMNEWLPLGAITAIGFVTGFVYVVRIPPQGLTLARIFIVGPLMVAPVFISVFIVWGLFEGPPAPGTGIAGVIVAAFAYGLVTTFYGIPGALVGGGLGALVGNLTSKS